MNNKPYIPQAWRYARPVGLVAGALVFGAAYSPASAQLLASSQVQQLSHGASSPATETVLLKSLLKQWEGEYQASILYESALVGDKRVPLPTGKTSLEAQLNEVLPLADLGFKKLRDNYFIVTEGLKPPVVLPVGTSKKAVADVTVAGRVTQANGEALPGVTVLVKGTTIGTSTGPDGSFSLSVPENSVLVFSSVGFVQQEVPVTGAKTDLVIKLAENAEALKEVVVVGYGTQERQSVTGAVSSVSGRDIAAQPVGDPAQALQGRAAGVQVVSNSGSPGGQGGTSVRIRGITSAGNNSPLYVVDGFPLPTATDRNGNATGTELNNINPNDIESIDVLKDASATAIYGLRAANGVVLITTKRGKAGTATVNLDAYVGTQSLWREIPLLNAQQFAELNNEAFNNYNAQFPNNFQPLNPRFATPELIAALPTTNFIDEIIRSAKIQNYSLSATGGSEKVRYAVSAGYFQQDGTIINTSFERFTLRANGEVQLSKKLKIGNTLAYSYQKEKPLPNENNEAAGPIQTAIATPPFLPARNPDGTPYSNGSTPNDRYNEDNPIAIITRPILRNNRNQVTTTFYAELEPLSGLRLRTNVGADLQFNQNDQFFPSIPGSLRFTPQASSAVSNSTYAPSYLIENTATYDRTFAEKHQLTVLLGQSSQQFDNFYLGGSRFGQLSNLLQGLDQGPINAQLSNTGGNSRSRLASYFTRLNYEFAGKYLLSAVARYDGSSAFPPGNSFGFFPGVSVGWRLSEEGFLKDASYLSNLKLRAGYGRVGNPLNAGTFGYLSLINSNTGSNNSSNPQGTSYVFGTGAQNVIIGGVPTRLANRNLRWETNEQYNIGVDVGVFENRISGSIDVYKRISPNLLLNVPVSFVSGTSEAIPTNAASATNRGIDLSLTTNNFTSPDNGFTWSTTLNLSAYRSELTSLGAGRPFDAQASRLPGSTLVRYDAGQPFGSFFGYVADGLFQTADEVAALNAASPTRVYQTAGTAPGDIKFRDVNGDGIINAGDRTFIGDPNPKFTYGLNNTLGYKGFDLSVFLQGSQGNDIFNLNRALIEGSALTGTTNGSTEVLERWTPTNTNTDIPRAVAIDPNQNTRISSQYVEDGSYMRIKLLTLGYTLPAGLLTALHSQRIRVYVSAQNLATFTKYTGFDPELGNTGGSSGVAGTLGVDRGVYPQARVILGGINFGF